MKNVFVGRSPTAVVALAMAAVGVLAPFAHAAVVNDFEGGTLGERSGFQDPYFSGTTTSNIDQTPEIINSARVVQGFDSNASKVLQVGFRWSSTAGPGRWLRLTTFYDGFIDLGQPRNPLIPLNVGGTAYAVSVDVYAQSDLLVALGVRERAAVDGTEVVAGNGGTSGPIEFVGAQQATASGATSPGGKLVAAGAWTTLTFRFDGSDSVFAFTGNGALSTAWGVLEHLAISPAAGNDATSIAFYLDNLRVEAVPAPASGVMMGLAGMGLARRARRR